MPRRQFVLHSRLVVDSYLSIGGITFCIRGPWTWDEPLSRFLAAPSEPDVELSVVIGPAPPHSGKLVFDSGAVWRLYEGQRIECRSALFGDAPYKTAVFDDTFTRGTIYLRDEHLNPLDYPLDEVLVANLLGRGRGVELHACGIIDHAGVGRLFVGASGAGKTTMARLWDRDARSIVSDDRVIVRETGGALRMYGTPWHGEAELSANESAPLAGVYLLVQSDANAIREIDPSEAVARLFACAFPLFHDAAALDFTLRFLERVGPVYELKFVRDRSVVALLASSPHAHL